MVFPDTFDDEQHPNVCPDAENACEYEDSIFGDLLSLPFLQRHDTHCDDNEKVVGSTAHHSPWTQQTSFKVVHKHL